jgi:hypothetical protein
MYIYLAYAADVHPTDSDYFGALPHLGYFSSGSLCLVDVASDDTSICAEMDQSPCLRAANGPGSACDEDDAIGWTARVLAGVN